MKTKSPSLKQRAGVRAQEYLLGLIGKKEGSSGMKLPSIRTMALMAGVSKVTMAAAVHALTKKGVLTVIPGGGVLIRQALLSSQVQASPVIADGHDERLVSDAMITLTISRDILNGRYAAGERLPPYKTLMHRYGTCYEVLRRIMQQLLQQGRVERYKRGFRIPPQHHIHAGAFILLVTTHSAPDSHAEIPSRIPEFWRSLERECSINGVGLVVKGIYDAPVFDPGKSGWVRDPMKRVHLGTIVWNTGIGADHMGVLCMFLKGTGRPAAFFEETHIKDYPRSVAGYPLFQRFVVGMGTFSGQKMGEFLISLGHRNVACFETYRNDATFASRMDGLRSAFTFAGLSDGVTQFQLNRFDDENRLGDEMASMEPFKSLLYQERQFIHALGWPDEHSSPWAIGGTIRSAIQYQFMRELFAPLFKQALQSPDITAWVMYNDMQAFVAMPFLNRSGVRIPKDISIVGFDDTAQAFSTGLVSYNFNIPGVIKTMIDFITHPERNKGGVEGVVEVPGFISMRQSVKASV